MKRCIFCPNNADSREYGLPEWVLKRFATRPKGLTGMTGGETFHDPEQESLRVRCVCTCCNTGWMKGLEDAALPSVSSLMADLSMAIDVATATMIAAWILKTAMVMEQVTAAKPHVFFTDEERAAMKSDLRIPHRTRVWLARYARADPPVSVGDDLTTTTVQGFAGYVMTAAYKHLAVQAISLRAAIEDDRRLVFRSRPGPWTGCTVSIWPPERTVSWPPRISLRGPEQLRALANRWGQVAR